MGGTVKILKQQLSSTPWERCGICVGLVTDGFGDNGGYVNRPQNPWDEDMENGNLDEACFWSLTATGGTLRTGFYLPEDQEGWPCSEENSLYRKVTWAKQPDDFGDYDYTVQKFPEVHEGDTITVSITGGKVGFALNGEQMGPLVPLPEGNVALAVSLPH